MLYCDPMMYRIINELAAKHLKLLKCLTFKCESCFTAMLGWNLQSYIILGHASGYSSLEGLQSLEINNKSNTSGMKYYHH